MTGLQRSRKKAKLGVLAKRGTIEDPGVAAITVDGITALSMDRPGKDVSFHGLPGPLWDRLPGIVTGRLRDDDGDIRIKVIKRGDRKVTFFSEPEKVRR